MTRKRLYRSRHDKMLLGVAAGLAKYFDVEVTLVRLAWLVALFGKIGLPAYILAAIIIPPEPGPASGARIAPDADADVDADSSQPRRLFGWLLLLLGGWLLFERLIPWWNLQYLWPAALVILGLYLLLQREDTA